MFRQFCNELLKHAISFFVLLKYYVFIGNQAKWLFSFDFLFFYTSPVAKYFFCFQHPARYRREDCKRSLYQSLLPDP